MPSDIAGTVRTAAALPEGGPALPSRISWGAVAAGSLIAAVIAATLNILGAAIGATTVDAVAHASPGVAPMGIGAAIWLVVATHQVNITGLTGVVPSSGEGVVLERSGGDLVVVGRVKP